MSRNWDLCHKGTEMRVKAAMAAMKCLGFPMFVVRTYDTPKKQLEIYAQGRTKPGNKVTWTKIGWHNLQQNTRPMSRAVDLAFRKQDRFTYGQDPWSYHWPWARLKKIALALGLSIPLAKDKGHLVDKQGQTFQQALKSQGVTSV